MLIATTLLAVTTAMVGDDDGDGDDGDGAGDGDGGDAALKATSERAGVVLREAPELLHDVPHQGTPHLTPNLLQRRGPIRVIDQTVKAARVPRIVRSARRAVRPYSHSFIV